MGIEMKLITADQAYHDNDGSLLEDTGGSFDHAGVLQNGSTRERRPMLLT
jgi:hypothetical protein